MEISASPARWLDANGVAAYERRFGCLKRRERFLLSPLDLKELCQARDREDVEDFGLEVAEQELAPGRFGLLVEQDQLVEGRRDEELDIGKVEQHVFSFLDLDEGKQLVAQLLNDLLVHQLLIEKLDHADVAGAAFEAGDFDVLGQGHKVQGSEFRVQGSAVSLLVLRWTSNSLLAHIAWLTLCLPNAAARQRERS